LTASAGTEEIRKTPKDIQDIARIQAGDLWEPLTAQGSPYLSGVAALTLLQRDSVPARFRVLAAMLVRTFSLASNRVSPGNMVPGTLHSGCREHAGYVSLCEHFTN
jgi:hypothetical protein